MNQPFIIYYAKKYFPHLMPLHGENCVVVIVDSFLKRRPKVEFANSDEQAEMVEFENILSVNDDGWAQLAPYGDFTGKGFRRTKSGGVEKFPAIQRMDRAAAQDMAAKFNSPASRIKRFFVGCPIYNGHPNTLIAEDEYPDRAAKGTIVELQARADALYCKPVFFNEAEPILSQSTKIFFSGHWTSDELPQENGKRIFRPDKLKSAGLTPFPNLPVEHVNDRENKPQNENDMTKQIIITFLAAHGVQFANDATDEQVSEALKNLGTKAKTADTLAAEKTQWANDKASLTGTITARDHTITQLTTERDTFKTNFANERAARTKLLLDGALTEGRITAAERPQWETRLGKETEFANESEALGKLGKKVKTESVTLDMGGRKVEIANATDRAEAVRTLVRAEQAKNGNDYDTAYATVKKANPALFEAMTQTDIKMPKY